MFGRSARELGVVGVEGQCLVGARGEMKRGVSKPSQRLQSFTEGVSPQSRQQGTWLVGSHVDEALESSRKQNLELIMLRLKGRREERTRGRASY
jgi:hypothetical protein